MVEMFHPILLHTFSEDVSVEICLVSISLQRVFGRENFQTNKLGRKPDF